MRNYKDLMVWEKAHKLTLDIYKETQCFSERRTLWVNKPGAARFVVDSRELGGRLRSAIGW